MIHYYRVAELTFGVALDSDDTLAQQMSAYRPFACKEEKGVTLLFVLTVKTADNSCFDVSQCGVQVLDSQTDGENMQVYRDEAGCYSIVMYANNDRKGRCCLKLNKNFDAGQLVASGTETTRLYGLNNALMMLFAFAGARRDVLLFHSSVIRKDGKGYLFLGKSGTGKSTHSQLWLRYIPDTELLNDDNPAVRIMEDGQPYVFGTPWSGKTSCYRNESAVVAGFVRLWQAPENRIERLSKLKAYAALLPTVSCMKWEKNIADGVNETLSVLVTSVPVFGLHNRPEREAALMSYEALTDNKKR